MMDGPGADLFEAVSHFPCGTAAARIVFAPPRPVSLRAVMFLLWPLRRASFAR